MWPRRNKQSCETSAKETCKVDQPTDSILHLKTNNQDVAVSKINGSKKRAISDLNKDDDMGWLLRTLQRKKLKKKKKTEQQKNKDNHRSKFLQSKINERQNSTSTVNDSNVQSSNVVTLVQNTALNNSSTENSGISQSEYHEFDCPSPMLTLDTDSYKNYNLLKSSRLGDHEAETSPSKQKAQAVSEKIESHKFRATKSTKSFKKTLHTSQIPSAATEISNNISANKLSPITSTGDENEWSFSSSSKLPLSLDAFAQPLASTPTPGLLSDKLAYDFELYKEEGLSRYISSNFQKQRLLKRVRGRSGRAHKLPEYLRGRGTIDVFSDTVNLENSWRVKTAKITDDSSSRIGGPDDSSDFIHDCLDVMQQIQNTKNGGKVVTLDNINSHKDLPPRCEHGQPCTLCTVKKRNKNYGRNFFACARGLQEGKCGFFLWEEDHIPRALNTLVNSITQGISTSHMQSEVGISESNSYLPLDFSLPFSSQRSTLLTNLRLIFKHPEFRPAQEWAITRVLERKHAILVLPTGAGKSLCYQYPSIFCSGLTLVISPLISLMNDQYENLPPLLQSQAFCLNSSNTSKSVYASFIPRLFQGEIKLIFASPEKVLSAGFQRLLQTPYMQENLDIVCLDEAHCISEWSHHFRPAFLRLKDILAQSKCVLAMTATASSAVIKDIVNQLPNTNNKDYHTLDTLVRRSNWERSNLKLQVLRVATTDERTNHLLWYLKRNIFGAKSNTKSGGVLIYVHQKFQCEELVEILKNHFKSLPKTTNSSCLPSNISTKIAFYHSSMSPEDKESVRKKFISGKIRVVVATLAFGMGIDKQNVRFVIHYHAPSSIEHYVQQIGRAGRDGKVAYGLLYLFNQDILKFRSLVFSNSININQLKRLVSLIFDTKRTEQMKLKVVDVVENRTTLSSNWKRILVMDVGWLMNYLDMKSATIETFLTLLSIQKGHNVRTDSHNGKPKCIVRASLLSTTKAQCVIHMKELLSQSQSNSSDKAASDGISIARVINAITSNMVTDASLHREQDGYLRTIELRFHLSAMAQYIYATSGISAISEQTLEKKERTLLQSIRKWQTDGIIQKFDFDPNSTAFRLEIDENQQIQDNISTYIDKVTAELFSQHEQMEINELRRLIRLHGAINSAAKSIEQTNTQTDIDAPEYANTSMLEAKITNYFNSDMKNSHIDVEDNDYEAMNQLTQTLTTVEVDMLKDDAMKLLKECISMQDNESYDIHLITSTTIAKILHGISTPCFPISNWKDHILWRKYEAVPFERVVEIINPIIV